MKGSGPRAAPAAVMVVAALVYSVGLGRPGIWRDEAATLVACRRSLPELFELTRHVDLVHLLYYLLAHGVWQVDPSVTAVRAVSLVAMVLTAGVLVGIGHRLGSLRVGVLAGLLFAAAPFSSRFAQEARSFALVTFVAALLTYLLLGLLAGTRLDESRSRRRLVGYGACVILLGALNVLALQLIVVHAVVVYAAGRDDAKRQLRRAWLLVTVPALVLLAPFVFLALTQRGQIDWIARPGPGEPIRLAGHDFGSPLAALVIGFALATAMLLSRRLPLGPARSLAFLGAVWGLLPVALLWTVSQIVPTWDYHYLLFSLPGVVLMIAALVPDADRRLLPAVVAVVLVAGVGVPAQLAHRQRDGHWGENLDAVAAYLGPRAQPGDAVLFVPSELRVLAEDFPDRFAKLEDVAVVTSPLDSGTLVGVPASTAELLARLGTYQRVWIVRGDFIEDDALPASDRTALAIVDQRFREVQREQITDVEVVETVPH